MGHMFERCLSINKINLSNKLIENIVNNDINKRFELEDINLTLFIQKILKI